MPYRPGHRLPAERASRLGHLDVLNSDLVNSLVNSFENVDKTEDIDLRVNWEQFSNDAEPLSVVFGIDGSLQAIEDERPPYKALAFVKTALLRLDQRELSKIDSEAPNPFMLRDLLSQSALYHATVFPLRNVSISQVSNYDAIRTILYQSLLDPSLGGEPFETLKWLAYEKWENQPRDLPLFECPHCDDTVASLVYDSVEGHCGNCGGHLFLTDMLGFHQVMTTDAAPNSVASDYMGVHETLLLFTAIRHFWETKPEFLKNCLFVKDGPLSIRAQYSKLVAPIRRFLDFALGKGFNIHIIGQEKSGAFFDHFDLIGRQAPTNSICVLSDEYIKEKIQQRPNRGAPYGRDTNYGAKVLVKLDEYTKFVINIPTGNFKPNPTKEDLIGFDRILSTLPTILSSKFEGGLLPIELAHGIASLSTYPSAHILRMFSGE